MGTVAASAEVHQLAQDLALASGTSIEHSAATIISQAAQQIQSVAQAKAPMRTGRLARSIRIRYNSPMSIEVGPEVPYGVFQEYGTGTKGEFPGSMYEIRPRRANTLAFKIDNRWIFTKLVKHPGIKPHPYMRPAFEQVLATVLPKLLEAGTAQITKGPAA